ncbi:MAG TPA: TadE/TadG family type IV pilus assembly protein [Sphingomicrobium sp.]|nr:TadE/TadG family type IV pilus assembly protein [Sphingomicrobium sp.]
MLKLAHQALRNERGVAFMEFALAFPILLVTVAGGIEVTNLAIVHTKLNHIAETAADNAARVRTQIDESDVAEIFSGVGLVGQSIDFQNKGRVVLSSIQDNEKTGSDHGQWIRWQRCYGNYSAASRYGTQGTGQSTGTLATGVGPAGRKITATPGTAIMFAEVTYQYDPMIFTGFLSSRVLRYETAFTVRERTNFGITNVDSLTVSSC